MISMITESLNWSINTKSIVIPGILLNVMTAGLFVGEREMYLV